MYVELHTQQLYFIFCEKFLHQYFATPINKLQLTSNKLILLCTDVVNCGSLLCKVPIFMNDFDNQPPSTLQFINLNSFKHDLGCCTNHIKLISYSNFQLPTQRFPVNSACARYELSAIQQRESKSMEKEKSEIWRKLPKLRPLQAHRTNERGDFLSRQNTLSASHFPFTQQTTIEIGFWTESFGRQSQSCIIRSFEQPSVLHVSAALSLFDTWISSQPLTSNFYVYNTNTNNKPYTTGLRTTP